MGARKRDKAYFGKKLLEFGRFYAKWHPNQKVPINRPDLKLLLDLGGEIGECGHNGKAFFVNITYGGIPFINWSKTQVLDPRIPEIKKAG